MKKRVIVLKHSITYYAYLIVVWGFYRLLFQAPAPFEELIIKPIVWLVPLYILLKKEKASVSSIGFFFNNLFKTAYFAIGLGFVFSFLALFVNYLKYKGFYFDNSFREVTFLGALLLSFITAISEEIAFRGYLLSRLIGIIKNEWKASLIVSLGWVLIHLPIAIFDWRIDFASLLVYLAVIFLFSMGTTIVFLRTRNILAPILLHVFWQWPIILYR